MLPNIVSYIDINKLYIFPTECFLFASYTKLFP